MDGFTHGPQRNWEITKKEKRGELEKRAKKRKYSREKRARTLLGFIYGGVRRLKPAVWSGKRFWRKKRFGVCGCHVTIWSGVLMTWLHVTGGRKGRVVALEFGKWACGVKILRMCHWDYVEPSRCSSYLKSTLWWECRCGHQFRRDAARLLYCPFALWKLAKKKKICFGVDCGNVVFFGPITETALWTVGWKGFVDIWSMLLRCIPQNSMCF